MAETKNRNPLAGVSLADKAKAWKETDLTKSAKERAKGRRAAENTERVQIDVTEGVGELLDQVAAEMHTTRSAVAEYLLWQGLVYGDPDELRMLLVPARSPRYEFKLARSGLADWRSKFGVWLAKLGKKAER